MSVMCPAPLWTLDTAIRSACAPTCAQSPPETATIPVTAGIPRCPRSRQYRRNSRAKTACIKSPACGLPEAEARSKPFRLGDHDGHVGESNLLPRLGRLIGHQLLDALEDRFLHGENLRV